MTYLTVVVPTRNEADNVEPLVSRVTSALQPLDLPWEMLFVDDSDDPTPDRVLEAERAGHPVHQRVLTDAHLHPEGFKILLELLVRGAWNRIAEIPCPLDPRLHGQSKAGLDQAAAFARHLVRLAACTTPRRSFTLRGGEPLGDQDDRPSSPPGELAG